MDESLIRCIKKGREGRGINGSTRNITEEGCTPWRHGQWWHWILTLQLFKFFSNEDCYVSKRWPLALQRGLLNLALFSCHCFSVCQSVHLWYVSFLYWPLTFFWFFTLSQFLHSTVDIYKSGRAHFFVREILFIPKMR